MFDSDKPDVYEKVYEELLERLAAVDLAAAARTLDLECREGAALVRFFNRDYLVSSRGVLLADGGQAFISHRIVLAWYLIHAGRGETSGRFVPYRELSGGADFARSLSQTVEDRIARVFGGRLDDLRAAADDLGAEPARIESRPDLALVIPALPKVPLMFTFYDADDEFPAEVKVFYDLTAPNFLDLECLAAMGVILVKELEWHDPARS